ncbi:hypothetical protein JZ751_004407 [Albula glossodonta]|uniref:Uncharacterized protein n=1 Tax=Albula glossodonta TaxID=121402 RepID=A0A8T2MMW3_9TELE|nr:hypothetical protein JZ751_004407 [Albula glossodonta]
MICTDRSSPPPFGSTPLAANTGQGAVGGGGIRRASVPKIKTPHVCLVFSTTLFSLTTDRELVNLLQWYSLPTMYSLEFCLGQLGNLLVILGYIFCLKECILVQNLKRAYIITRPIVLAHSVVNPAFYFLLGDRFWELLLGRVKLLFS